MSEQNPGEFLIYGGTRGIGLLIAKRLNSCGITTLIVGRTEVPSVDKHIESVRIDFSMLDGFRKNRKLLRTRPSVKNFIFNIGGSFGIHDASPSIKDFLKLAKLNVGYIMDTVNFLERNKRLFGATLVFVISECVHTKSGSVPYRILKIALDEYAQSLESVYAGKSLTILRFYPPLILYPDRYLAGIYLSMKTESDRIRFAAAQLQGRLPVLPESIADEIANSIIKNLPAPQTF